MIDLNELDRLAELVESSNISELTLREGKARITIRRRDRTAPASAGMLVPYGYPAGADVETESPDDDDLYIDAGDFEDEEEASSTSWIAAPLVGIFHHIKPMTGIGAKIRPGQVVGEIAAMKIVSEIRAESEGRITDVLAEDGMAVEYGQALFEVEREP